MRLVVLGGAAYGPVRGTACPGYLVQAGGALVLLDCGPGIATALGTLVHPAYLSAVLISHVHPDHCLDLLPLGWSAYSRPLEGLNDLEAQGTGIPIWLPPGGANVVEAVARAFEPDFPEASTILDGTALSLREYDPEEEIRIGRLGVRFFGPTAHSARGYAFRLAADGVVLAYSGDGAPSRAALRAAQGADLFICEATWPGEVAPIPGTHMTVHEAAETAAEAGAGALLLTHLLSVESEYCAELASAARERFPGPVYVAESGLDLYVYARPRALVA